MLVHKAGNVVIVEQVAPAQRRVQNSVFDESAETIEHPLVDRRADTLFSTIEHAVGYCIAERSFEDMFRLAVLILHRGRKRHRELDKRVIEKRHPCFYRRCHRDLVEFAMSLPSWMKYQNGE